MSDWVYNKSDVITTDGSVPRKHFVKETDPNVVDPTSLAVDGMFKVLVIGKLDELEKKVADLQKRLDKLK